MSKETFTSHDPNNYWEQLERLEKLIRSSELKAGVIFSFHSLIIGLFIDRIVFFQENFIGSPILIVFACLWIVCVLISIYFCFKCFMPRIDSKNAKNVFFFRDAVYAFGSIDDYSKKLMEVCSSQEEFFIMLSEQIYVESRIIDKKFRSVQNSIKFFALSCIFVILMIVFSLLQM